MNWFKRLTISVFNTAGVMLPLTPSQLVGSGNDAKEPQSDGQGAAQILGPGFGSSAKALVDGKLSDTTLRIIARTHAIAHAVSLTAAMEQETIERAVLLLGRMIATREPVRVIGVGRARLAMAIPANRLFHAGSDVHIVYDLTPLPNTIRGGYLIVGSASGKTKDVLEMMRTTRRLNPRITIVGLADAAAQEFKDLCHLFIGISADPRIPSAVRALADLPEYVISELLDSMVVLAAHRIGLNDEDMRNGHEDLWTGPYGPGDREKSSLGCQR